MCPTHRGPANFLFTSRFGLDRCVVSTIVRYLSLPDPSLLRSVTFTKYGLGPALQGLGRGLASSV